jgi:hypothetical protein
VQDVSPCLAHANLPDFLASWPSYLCHCIPVGWGKRCGCRPRANMVTLGNSIHGGPLLLGKLDLID